MKAPSLRTLFCFLDMVKEKLDPSLLIKGVRFQIFDDEKNCWEYRT